jgi:hypothetical protein
MKITKIDIYQIQLETFEANRDLGYLFLGWRFAKDVFNLDDYKLVYHMGYSTRYTKDEDILEDIWVMFNREERTPANYIGRSLSVSDVVGIDGRLYFCDSVGWKRI